MQRFWAYEYGHTWAAVLMWVVLLLLSVGLCSVVIWAVRGGR